MNFIFKLNNYLKALCILCAVLLTSSCDDESYDGVGDYITNGADTVDVVYRIASIDLYDTSNTESNIYLTLDTSIDLKWSSIIYDSDLLTKKFLVEYKNGYIQKLVDERTQDEILLTYQTINGTLTKKVKTLQYNRPFNPFAFVFYYDSGYCVKIEKRLVGSATYLITEIIEEQFEFCKNVNISDCTDSSKAQYLYSQIKNPLLNANELFPILFILNNNFEGSLQKALNSVPILYSKYIPVACAKPNLTEYEFGFNSKFEYTFLYYKDASTKKINGLTFNYR